jgi:putative transposase
MRSRRNKPPAPLLVRSEYRCPEEVWTILETLIPKHLPKPHPLGCYRHPIDDRKIADAIWHVMKTGCPWAALDQTNLAKHSTAHARFQAWVQAGVFEQLWQRSLEGFDCLVGLDWTWLCVDGAMGKAPLGGEKDREKSHRSRQTGRQRLRGHRGSWRAGGPGGGRSQPARLQVAGSDADRGGPPTAGAHAGPRPACLPG